MSSFNFDFLKRLKIGRLSVIDLNTVSGLGQEFFDQMTETIRLNAIPLQQLRLKSSSNGIRNFEFLLKLRDLELLKTD